MIPDSTGPAIQPIQVEDNEARRTRNRPIVRLIAVNLACLFGCLWLAMLFSLYLAPPEPDFAFRMRHLCLLLFLITLSWSIWLYAGWVKEVKEQASKK